MASTMRTAPAQRSAFFGARTFKSQVSVVAAPKTRSPVAAQALFGFFGKKEAAEPSATPIYICVACGYIYDGDFKSTPSNYKCPVCNVPKSKFKVFKGAVKGRPNNGQSAMKKRFEEKQW